MTISDNRVHRDSSGLKREDGGLAVGAAAAYYSQHFFQ